ncbi:MAG TPA: hypothetical protein VH442_15550 [Micromonosporaceae bacterium]
MPPSATFRTVAHRTLPGMVAAAALALSVAACNHAATGTGVLGAASNPSPGFGAVSGAPSSGATTPTATPTKTGATARPYPSDYARAILTAWSAHDTSYLTLLTGTSTKNQLYGIGTVDQHWTLANSQGASGSSYSAFFNRDGDWLVLRTINAQTAAHQWHAGSVQTWDKISYPTDATAYVTYYMNAYIDGNTARMTKLGTQTMTTHFVGLASKPDSGYALGAAEGTAGHTHIEVTEASVSFDVTFRLANQTLGQAGAIEGCDSGC